MATDFPDLNLILPGMTISCAELPDSCSLHFGKGGATGTRKFHVAWDDRFDFIEELIGGPVFENGELVGFSDPDTFPGRDELVSTRAHIEGVGALTRDSAGQPHYQAALVTIVYEVPESKKSEGQDESERTLSTETLDFSAEYLLSPSKAFAWTQYTWGVMPDGSLGRIGGGASSGPVLAQTGILIPTIVHTFNKSDVAVLPYKLIRDTIGRMNSQPFPPDLNAGDERAILAGMLLFEGCSARRALTSRGQQNYELTLTFRERIVAGWDYILSPTDGKWTQVTPSPYREANFAGLLELTA